MENDKVASIVVPTWILMYLEKLSTEVYAGDLNRMHNHMLEMFFAAAPWQAKPTPLCWKAINLHGVPLAQIVTGDDPDFTILNFALSLNTLDKIDSVIKLQNIELDTFLYTAVAWWCTYIYPVPK